MAELLARLRQRKLVQWALAYLAGAWVLLQVADLIGQKFGWPDAVGRVLIIAVLVGFFVTLLLAWYHGERGEQKVSGIELMLLTLLLVIGGALLWRYASAPPAPAAAQAFAAGVPAVGAGPGPTGIPAKSIAVLPFENLSADKDNAYFADGLSEEIINSLTRVPDLRVAARTSSFALRGGSRTVPQIAAELHVATVLEGSVRRSADRLRITAQLIRAADGYDLWSERYDRSSDDIIAIQEDVARSIAQALKTATDPVALAAMQRAGTRSVPAYQAYLQGLARLAQAEAKGDLEAGHAQAQADFDRAIASDPRFVDAYAASANLQLAQLDPTSMGSPTADETYRRRLDRLRRDLDQATGLARNPHERDYYAALRAATDQQYLQARRLMAAYVRNSPGRATAMANLASWALQSGDYPRARYWAEALARLDQDAQSSNSPVPFLIWAGDYPRAAELARQELRAHPGQATTLYNAHRALLAVGEVKAAAELVPQIAASSLGSDYRLLVRMRQLCAEGRTEAAERLLAANRAGTTDKAALWHLLTLLGRYDEAARLLGPLDTPAYLNALAAWLYYPQFDVTRYPHLQAVLVAQGIHRPAARLPPFACKPAAGAAP